MVQRKLNPLALGLLGVLAASCATASLAEARPAGRAKTQARTTLAHLDTASTECFAEAVLANPVALAHAKASRWYQAAGVIGVVCRREVDRMMQARDAIQGPGAGQRYFRTVYAKRLDRELAARLRPWLERQSVASADLRNEQPVEAAPE
ncbi:hypothetical protein [Methylobacterium iners]|uniref:Lipoprotein n=1 Tax=Methylobacterium iners TaxID=418707 RepID=A0ABQ4S5U2_9HYPH|nr:hypothetical protein [Methylobacterium iners]GJD97930.1 hypothetical protein OCOJLMKI_5169 [Methylobacterium iners]